MITWYKKLQEKIQFLMNQEGFSSYTILLSLSKKEKIISTNFTITSIEIQEIEVISLQIYYNNKYYKTSITGFKNIEEEIKKLKEIFTQLEDNDYFEEKNLYHNPVHMEIKKPVFSLNILENEMNKIHSILKNYNNIIDEMLQLASYHSEEFIFNGANYEHYNYTEYSDIYISLCYKYANDSMESEWDYFPLKDNINWQETIHHLVINLYEYANKAHMESGLYPIIFNYKVSSSLIDMIVSALYGDNLWHNKSFIKKDDLDKMMFASNINIIENPNLNDSIYNSPVDYSGMDIETKYLVKDGKIKNFLLNLEYGKKLEMKATGNSWFGAIGYTNIYLEPGILNYNELLENMQNGIIVMEILGNGFLVHNGEISVSIKGFKLTNGKINGTINGTISGNIKTILKENVYLANDIIYDQEMNSPSIQVDSMMFASASKEIIEEE